MTDRRKPWRVRLKVWRFILNVELAYRKDARTNRQLREDRERFWVSFDRAMKSPAPQIKVSWNNYDSGGPLQPGSTMAYNDTDEPEQVL